MCCVWGARYLRATGRRRMLGSFNHGSMANALPMAIGAAFARPGQEVVALCGDGGLSMLLGDLATIVEYKLPVKIVVFDNRSLGMVKLEMEVSGLPDWQTDMCNPDFESIARAMGIRGFTADSPDSVAEVLAEAFDTPGPVLVNVRTDPNALAMPPKVEFGQMKGFALAMTRLILSAARRGRRHGQEQSETPPRTGLTGAARLLFRRGGFVRPVGVENSVEMVCFVLEDYGRESVDRLRFFGEPLVAVAQYDPLRPHHRAR